MYRFHDTALDIKIHGKRRDTHNEYPWQSLLTIQGALYRGERHVYLDSIPASYDFYDYIRHNHDLNDGDPAIPHELPYASTTASALANYTDEDAQRGIANIDWEGFEVKFEKILTAGGFGAATLWNVKFEDGSTEKIVIKRAVKPGSSFKAKNEHEWHARYRDNPHVVQPRELHQVGQLRRREAIEAYRASATAPLPRNMRGNEFRPDDMNILVLEFVDHGSLWEILTKATVRMLNLPNRVLWEMWECLVTGLAVVAFQPALTNRGYREPFEALLRRQQEQSDDIYDEFLQNLGSYPFETSHDVHFDLEEQNTLVGRSASHKHGPILKLHDFGASYSLKMNEEWGKWLNGEYWRARSRSKRYRLTPEQMHQSWDPLVGTSLNGPGTRFQGPNLADRSKSQIAGRYGTWTNIFHIADVMQGAITKKYLLHPFKAKPYWNRSRRTNTYGWRLWESKFDHVERELRDIICRCLNERPLDRPTIPDLLRQIRRRKQRGFNMSDEQSKEWWDDLLIPKNNPTLVKSSSSGSQRSQGGVGLGGGSQGGAALGGASLANLSAAEPTGQSAQDQEASSEDAGDLMDVVTDEPSSSRHTSQEEHKEHGRHSAATSKRDKGAWPGQQTSPRLLQHVSDEASPRKASSRKRPRALSSSDAAQQRGKMSRLSASTQAASSQGPRPGINRFSNPPRWPRSQAAVLPRNEASHVPPGGIQHGQPAPISLGQNVPLIARTMLQDQAGVAGVLPFNPRPYQPLVEAPDVEMADAAPLHAGRDVAMGAFNELVPQGTIMRAQIVSDESVSDEGSEQNDKDDSSVAVDNLSSNNTSFPSTVSPEEAREAGNNKGNPSENSQDPSSQSPKKDRSRPTQFTPEPSKEPSREHNTSSHGRAPRSKSAKNTTTPAGQTPKKKSRKPRAWRMAEARHPNLAQLPVAIQNLLIRATSLEAYLGPGSSHEKETKKKKGDGDKDADRGNKK